MLSLFAITLFALLPHINSQVLLPRCNVCLRCTYCASDVLYDCSIDSIYAGFVQKNPAIAAAFPNRITKTNNQSSTVYFFQFSNGQNITYQIVNKNSSQSSTKIPSPSQDAYNNNTNLQSFESLSKSPSWQPIENPSQILLKYVISHFHLSTSSTITAIQQQNAVDTYSFTVKSQQSVMKISAVIDSKDKSVKIINMAYINGPLLLASMEDGLSKQNGRIPAHSNEALSPKTMNKAITVAKGLVVSQDMKQLLVFLLNSYNQLANFQLSAYSTTDKFSYNLTLTNIPIPSIKYTFQVLTLTPVGADKLIKTVPSQGYQIMSYELVNNPSNFTTLNTSQLIHSNPFAQEVINQIQSQIIQPLQLQNLVLVNISASTPFYVLFYEMQNQTYRFLVSFDVLTSKIRVIEQKISGRGKEVAVQQPKIPISVSPSSQSNNLGLTMTQIRQKNVSLAFSNASTSLPINSQTLPQNILPPMIPVRQVPSSSSPLNYINFRVDPVFLKAASALSDLYDFNRSSIIKVSSVDLPNFKQYTITINLNLPSNKFLQFNADYNTLAKTINTSNFLYIPQSFLDASLFQPIGLNQIGTNKVVMSTISSIFLQYPQFFNTSVSTVLQVMAYPPYFNITYNNSAFGILRFDCEYNYLTNNATLLNFSIHNIKNAPSLPSDTPINISTNNSTNSKSTTFSHALTNPSEMTVPSASTNDLFCISYKDGVCSQCTFRFYYDQQKQKCWAVQDWCYEFNYNNKSCSSCFSGYVLIDGSCHLP